MKNSIFFIVLILFLSGCTQNRQHWNQYLGPNRNASVQDTKISQEKIEAGPELVWEFPLGPGYGGASMFGEEVFVLDRIEAEADILRCIDLNSGEEKWNYQYEAEGKLPYPGSRTVPYVDDNFVYSVGPHGHFYCVDKQTQKPVWFHDLRKKFDAETPHWGFSQSPLIYNNLVIIAPQGKKAGVAAFEKKTGELMWESRPLSGYNFHVSPVLGNYGGVDQVIMISPYDRKDSTKTHEVVGFDVKTGEELWKYNGLKSFATISPATVVDDRRLFLTDCSYDGGYDPVSVLLEITKNENGFLVNEVFKTEEAGCKMHPAVFHEGNFYLNNTGRPGGLVCMNPEGELLWEEGESPNFELGGLILVDGIIINQNGKNGDIHFIEPSPDGYRELAKVSFFDANKSQAWAPPAFGNGKLVVRDLEKMVCIDMGN